MTARAPCGCSWSLPRRRNLLFVNAGAQDRAPAAGPGFPEQAPSVKMSTRIRVRTPRGFDLEMEAQALLRIRADPWAARAPSDRD